MNCPVSNVIRINNNCSLASGIWIISIRVILNRRRSRAMTRISEWMRIAARRHRRLTWFGCRWSAILIRTLLRQRSCICCTTSRRGRTSIGKRSHIRRIVEARTHRCEVVTTSSESRSTSRWEYYTRSAVTSGSAISTSINRFLKVCINLFLISQTTMPFDEPVDQTTDDGESC